MRHSSDPGKLLRNYHSVKFDHFDDNVDFETFIKIGKSIQCLTISSVTFTNPQSLRRIFYSLKILKKLSLIKVSSGGELESVDLPSTLMKLELTEVDHLILKYFAFEVLELEIIDANNRTDEQSLANFLARQNNLEILTIENLSGGANVLFDNDNSSKFIFKLNQLSMLSSQNHVDEQSDANLGKFLKLHKDTIKQLKVKGSFSHQTYKTAIETFKNLQELEINVSELPQEISFYDFLNPNRCLRLMKLNGTVTEINFNGFKGIVSHYVNVEQVFMADTDSFVSNDVFYLLSRLPNLNHLSVLNVHENFSPDVIFPSLKYFSIRILKKIDQWKTFVTNNKTIESLNVGWMRRDQFSSKIIEEIIDMPNLQHFKFGGRFTVCKRSYDLIKNDYKNLRTLELIVSNYDEVHKLKFIFPINKNLWMPQCALFDEGSDREPLND